eukprot:258860-Pelagomonas_calceolata.AAC.1
MARLCFACKGSPLRNEFHPPLHSIHAHWHAPGDKLLRLLGVHLLCNLQGGQFRSWRKPCTHTGAFTHLLEQDSTSNFLLCPANCRVATWKLARAMPGGEKMVYISRILHRMTPDEVMDE